MAASGTAPKITAGLWSAVMFATLRARSGRNRSKDQCSCGAAAEITAGLLAAVMFAAFAAAARIAALPVR